MNDPIDIKELLAVSVFASGEGSGGWLEDQGEITSFSLILSSASLWHILYECSYTVGYGMEWAIKKKKSSGVGVGWKFSVSNL